MRGKGVHLSRVRSLSRKDEKGVRQSLDKMNDLFLFDFFFSTLFFYFIINVTVVFTVCFPPGSSSINKWEDASVFYV